MIFKVSFKETDKNPSKAVKKVGKTTTVVLKGVVELPLFWKHIPEEIMEWIGEATKVECYENVVENTLIVYSSGISRCRPDDKYDSLLGERLAEARAKYNVYKFFYTLTYKLFEYYDRIMFGDIGVVGSGSGSCLAVDVKKYAALCIKESHHIEELLKDKEENG